MFTRLVRIQLIIFTIASIVGVLVMLFVYMRVPTLVGIGHLTVKVEMPRAAGLYRMGNVTYRGIQIGTVTNVSATDDGAVATLSLPRSIQIPTALTVHVRSMSAVGEQYVDLQPKNENPPFLADGATIPERDVVLPVQTGPMLDQVNNLVQSIPKDQFHSLLDESFTAFDGTGYDLGSLIDSGHKITGDLNSLADKGSALVEDMSIFLDGQAQTADSITTWTHSLAGVTGQIVDNDPQIRSILDQGPGFTDQVSRLLNQVKPTLPVLLANLTTLGQVGVMYRPGLEQLLVLVPPAAANFQAENPTKNYTGLPTGDFRIQLEDPVGCTVGYLPQSEWRSPADTTTVDTPDGLYCKLPQDSPLAVRGARNYPCMNAPGKRAPTVQECYSEQGYQPLAQRQHALGPAPLDPNLLAQGVLPDSRVDPPLFGPLQGTPPPPGANAPQPTEAPPSPPGLPMSPPPTENGSAPASSTQTSAAPASARTVSGEPSVAVTTYDPATGVYMAPDGSTATQLSLAAHHPRSWKDLVLNGV
ncbi:MCE family protein [Mycobacterium sp. EPa45]|uniref:MCE family protein n=1 Tax=Mycobacterium sp. EPa45 TaxID=1545728 RepID=UPI0006423E2C|nr:MlaD family protein [Mycobacterium sp. EPa45]AKK25489.1 hypothetical protein AB431_00800 [Mycobacterium sp. EPa45]